MKATLKKWALRFGLLLLFTVQASVVYLITHRRNSPAPDDPPRQLAEGQLGSTIDISNMPNRGSALAKVGLVEFSDYECPYCARHAVDVGKRLHEEFVSSGLVRHAFSNNPLSNHSRAVILANAAICAGQQNRYWEMYEHLFAVRPKSDSEVTSLALEIGLDDLEFRKCLQGKPGAKQIELDLRLANSFVW